MATDDEVATRREPGMALALLTVATMIGTIGILSLLIWALMVGVAATSSGKQKAPDNGPAPLQTQEIAQPKAPPTPGTPVSK